MTMSEIEIYKSPDNQIELQVNLEKDTVWLSQKQMAQLFGKDADTIGLHLKNIYTEQELEEPATTELFSVVQTEGKRKVKRKLKYFNLDAIISVGYRVNSKRGTQFRQWATQRLKDYLVKGFSINEKRLQETQAQFRELKQAVSLLDKVAGTKELSGNEAQGLLKILNEYSSALDLLDQFDHQKLKVPKSRTKELFRISYKDAIKAIEGLKEKFGGSELFGREKDTSFKSSLDGIYQTFDKKDLYPSIEEKAAQLLYFVVKNHSFVDGNKRIAAFLFVWFLEKNQLLYYQHKKVIDDNALVALTLLIAGSNPEDKNIMIKVIVNLIINRR
jgi:prophage maintenance system killer protein